MPQENSRIIEAVIKVTERCNINCKYCYVFNKGDESYKQHDIYMKPETIEALANYLCAGVTDIGATEVRVDFHGGEPLMIGKRRFDSMCSCLAEKISPIARLQFSLQTNGMLVDQEWVDIFRRYNMTVGVSLDGPQEINDIERIDHKGRGTYERAATGLKILREARKEGLISAFGVLTVVNPAFDAKRVYRHFVHELGVDSLDFLLPIDSHSSFDASTSEAYGKFLCDAFDEWVADDDPYVYVRIFAGTMGFLKEGQSAAVMMRQARAGDHPIITIASNGDVGPDDSLRTLNLGLFSGNNIRDVPLKEYLNSTPYQNLMDAEGSIPDGCRDCCWKNVCRGGAANGRLINRYSRHSGFNNTSIVCDGLQTYYSHVAAYILKKGLEFEQLQKSLIHNVADMKEYVERCPFSDNLTSRNDREAVTLEVG